LVWLLTAITIVVSCALTAARGWDILRYDMANPGPDEMRPWYNVSGLSFLARENAQTDVEDLNDRQKVGQRREEIAAILSVRPLSSEHWLSLAKMQLAMGQASTKVSAALELSVLTGPNEGTVMSHRGLFGLWRWQTLSAEQQAKAAADLTAIHLSANDAAWAKADLSHKPDVVRQQVRRALQADGLSTTEIARIGL
jgi:hypothetical protein